MNRKILKLTAALLLAYATVAATAGLSVPAIGTPEYTLYTVVCCLVNNLFPVAQAIAALIFVYAGARYAYSAEDPGGRKQAKSLAINSFIGMVIVIISQSLITVIVGEPVTCKNAPCPGLGGTTTPMMAFLSAPPASQSSTFGPTTPPGS